MSAPPLLELRGLSTHYVSARGTRVVRAVESRLMVEPSRYGQRLRRSLAGLWKLRVGDYRVVYEICGRTVTVWAVCHRKDVYDEAEKRWTH